MMNDYDYCDGEHPNAHDSSAHAFCSWCGRPPRELAEALARVDRLQRALVDALDYAGWGNPAYEDSLAALQPGDLP